MKTLKEFVGESMELSELFGFSRKNKPTEDFSIGFPKEIQEISKYVKMLNKNSSSAGEKFEFKILNKNKVDSILEGSKYFSKNDKTYTLHGHSYGIEIYFKGNKMFMEKYW